MSNCFVITIPGTHHIKTAPFRSSTCRCCHAQLTFLYSNDRTACVTLKIFSTIYQCSKCKQRKKESPSGCLVLCGVPLSVVHWSYGCLDEVPVTHDKSFAIGTVASDWSRCVVQMLWFVSRCHGCVYIWSGLKPAASHQRLTPAPDSDIKECHTKCHDIVECLYSAMWIKTYG